ncbi:hypothetical protein IF1G_00804 [Cordyceps javanica]|uniref:Uncharacterized protein n=1 Tax=Cordyceps javanica TaxID=43265 RepID=A0A545VGM9_9HYPO|nr:hypothetical protein IF1G_00804 [Cordyceps javanica]
MERSADAYELRHLPAVPQLWNLHAVLRDSLCVSMTFAASPKEACWNVSLRFQRVRVCISFKCTPRADNAWCGTSRLLQPPKVALKQIYGHRPW